MKQTPILMYEEMVRVTLADAKTQTRRVIKPQPDSDRTDVGYKVYGKPCPYGQIGDRIWVKETFVDSHFETKRRPVTYRAEISIDEDLSRDFKWTPAIFMPLKLSRITLEITGVKVERVRDISEDDALAEGVEPYVPHVTGMLKGREQELPSGAYRTLWNSINLKPSPIYEKVDGKKIIVSYRSYPWSIQDFEADYPAHVANNCIYRGKPIVITPNPWVWVIMFKRIPQLA